MNAQREPHLSASAIAIASVSLISSRLGRPVSVSYRAIWLILLADSRASVTSDPTPRKPTKLPSSVKRGDPVISHQRSTPSTWTGSNRSRNGSRRFNRSAISRSSGEKSPLSHALPARICRNGMPLIALGSTPSETAKRGLARTTRRCASISHSQSAALSSNSRSNRLTVSSRSCSAISLARITTSALPRAKQAMASNRVNSSDAAPSAGEVVRLSHAATDPPSTVRNAMVASGSAAIATDDAAIRIASTIHRPSAAAGSATGPKMNGAIDHTAPSASPSRTVSRTSFRLATFSVRWRAARRRKATARPTAAASAPQLANCQSGASCAKLSVMSAAPSTLAASMNSASWLPAFIWAARIGPQSVVSAGS